MEYVYKSIDKRALHKREYDSRVNEKQMQTTEEKVYSSKALDASLVEIESSGTESGEHDTINRSRNDAHVDDAYIKPTYDKSQWLRWVPTRKIFTSSTTKVDSEPTNGLNEDITNPYECEQTLNVSAAMTSDHNSSELEIHDYNNEPSSSKLVPKVVAPIDKTATLRQELELLFHHHITIP
ncbi:hypothetical protein Tco_1343113, partial [Tanacetum coccineum]